MGGQYSTLPRMSADFPYFCITFRAYDKLQIIHADENTLHIIIRHAIANAWPGGIREVENNGGMCVIKFVEKPFCQNTSKEVAIISKRMCCQLLSTLKQHGWTMLIASGLTRVGSDMTTWFFKRIGREVKTMIREEYKISKKERYVVSVEWSLYTKCDLSELEQL